MAIPDRPHTTIDQDALKLDEDPRDDVPLPIPTAAAIDLLGHLVDEGYAVTLRRNGLGMATAELERGPVRIGAHGRTLADALLMVAAFVR